MSDIVQKLWGFCHTLRRDGVDYGDYIEQLICLSFLKMAEERDVTADWHRLFDGRAMSKLVGVGVLTDTDSTHTQANADYAGIELYSQ